MYLRVIRVTCIRELCIFFTDKEAETIPSLTTNAAKSMFLSMRSCFILGWKKKPLKVEPIPPKLVVSLKLYFSADISIVTIKQFTKENYERK